MSFLKNLLWRIILLAGALLLTVYFGYRVTFINFSPLLVIFSILLFLAELHTIFHLYGMFYSLWPRKYKRYTDTYKNKAMRINIFICVCGEPTDIIRETVEAAKKSVAKYVKAVNPNIKPEVIVLNDGKAANKSNWQEIQLLAQELNVTHIAREVGGGFKAGNINNGLKETLTDDPHNTLDIVLDSDFSVKENFLLKLVKPFKDKTIDFAQSPQRYKHEKTWVAKAAAAHQIFFFDHVCDAKGYDNALFLCGTNFAIRRSALQGVGGMNTTFITEDFATSLDLHLQGRKGVFIPEVLAEGIAPSSLKQYFSQQQRWSKGSFDVSGHYLKQILFGKLTLRQKFHYLLSASYYLIGVRDLILMLAPLPYLLFGTSLINANSLQFILFVYGPLFFYNFILYATLFRNPIKSLVLDIASFPVFVAAFFASAFKKNLGFIVTIKKYEKENPFSVYRLQLLIVALLSFGIFQGLQHGAVRGGALLNYFWACFDVTILMLGFYLIVRENYNTAKLENVAQEIVGHSPVRRMAFATFAMSLVVYLFIQTPIVKTFAQHSLSFASSDVQYKKELLIPTKGVYYGYYHEDLNAHPATPKTEIIPNQKSSLIMYYQDWANQSSFDSEYLTKLSENNRIPVVTWEPWNSTKAMGKTVQHDFTPQTIIDGKHDAYIHAWAKDAAAYNKPFFLRFAHEMNGNWYPWGNQNSPETYIAMWRHVHDIFEEEGATNVIWLWSPNNTDEYGSTDSLLSYYPGDGYVDWVGFSAFNWGTTNKNTKWSSFDEVIASTYDTLKTINKPIMIAETSSVSTGGDKQAWFTHMLQNMNDFPQIKAVIFFDQNVKKADFSLNSGENFNKLAKKYIDTNPYYLKYPVLK